MSPVNLGIIITVGFSSLLLFRPFFYRSLVLSAPPNSQPLRAFQLDFGLCFLAGILINSFDHFFYEIPLLNLASLMIGCLIAGFFIGLDSSLSQERKVILIAKDKDNFSTVSKNLFPMTRKFTFVAVTTSFIISLVFILVFNRDVEWLVQTAQDSASIHEAQLSVTYEVFFIMSILMFLIVNLILSYSRNLKLLFENETRVLENVSRGDLSNKVPVATSDEFGLIAEHTNSMIDGLRHRFELINSLKLAEEVQQNLLPDHSPYSKSFDISGTSIYCDETGGDYYDYFLLPGEKFGIVVADVCGHGIGAAMLMTSVRAFLTSSVESYQNPAQLLGNINKHISRDCAMSGRFTTMFFLEIDSSTKIPTWVRAGHEPALYYNCTKQEFCKLDGSGLVLGVESSYIFENSSAPACQTGDIIVIGTDGINETRNIQNVTFGQERLEKLVRSEANNSAKIIQDAIVNEVTHFRGDAPQEDDITLVVIKVL